MNLQLTIAALLFSTFLWAQSAETGTLPGSYEEQPAHKRKTKIHGSQFDRVDYFFKDNILQSMTHYTGGGGYPRTWRYIYPQGSYDAIINELLTRHPNKKLHGATQVTFRNKLQYEVIMEDKKRWYIYQADSVGTITLKKRLRKH